MTERRQNGELRTRLDDIHVQYQRFARHVGIALTIMAIVLVASLALQGYLIAQNSDRANEIQSQRARSIVENCQAQNTRHDDTIMALDRVIAQAVKDQPERATQIRQARESNVLLINALAPKRSCQALLHRSVRDVNASE